MKISYYEVLGRTSVALLDGFWFGGTWLISRVNVPTKYRQTGVGGRLLAAACKDADNEGVTLSLHIFASGDMSPDDLYDWYQKHGFISTPGAGHPHIMHRPPVKVTAC